MKTRTATSSRASRNAPLALLALLMAGAALLAFTPSSHAQEPQAAPVAAPTTPGAAPDNESEVTTHPVAPSAVTSSDVAASPVKAPTAPAGASPRVEGDGNAIAAQVNSVMNGGADPSTKQLNILVDKHSSNAGVAPGAQPPKNPGAPKAGAKKTSTQRMQLAQATKAAEQNAAARSKPGIVIRAKPLPAPAPKKPAPPPPPKLPEEWSYHGLGGPENWGKLKPEYAMCGAGKQQSPIAINDDFTLNGPADPLVFSYKPSKATATDTGHSIEVKVYNPANSLTVRSTKYRLQQFHFHAPAEEVINGQRFPLGLHIVHRNDMGQLAVVAIVFDTGDGTPNPLIEKIWTHMPLGKNDSVRLPPDLVNLNEILPQDQRYYQYFGSLTTPPCTEGVLWIVLKEPVQISPEQLQMYTQLYEHTNRPLQPRNGRTVRDAIMLTGMPDADAAAPAQK